MTNAEIDTESVPSPEADSFISVFNICEGESVVLTYTSHVDKLRFFSAFIRDGTANGDRVLYLYPQKEGEMLQTALLKRGIDVKKLEKDGTLYLDSLEKFFLTHGRFDRDKAVSIRLNFREESRKQGYSHVRDIEDVGGFSFLKGKWQKYIEYWAASVWNDPKWAVSPDMIGKVYNPFIVEVTAVDVGAMGESTALDFLKAMGNGVVVPAKSLDLPKVKTPFSDSLSLSHLQLLGQKILFEISAASDYETVIGNLAKEAAANAEPVFVFTHLKSGIHQSLSRELTAKFFLTTSWVKNPELTFENETLLPAGESAAVLESLEVVLKKYVHTNPHFVFDNLSEILLKYDLQETQNFIKQVLEVLSSQNATVIFLFNSQTYDSETVSKIRGLFKNRLSYEKNGLILKIPKPCVRTPAE